MPPNSDRFVAAVEAVYSAAGAVDLWPAALDRIAECFDAVGTVLMYRQHDGSMAAITSPSLVEAGLAYEAGGWKLDFMVPRAIEAGISRPNACYTDRHLATVDEIATHPFYTEFRPRYGLGSFIGGVVSPYPDLPVIMTMQGAMNRPAFTDDEVNQFAKLARHVEKALVLTMRLVQADLGKLAFAEALSRLASGVFLLDGSGRVTFSNDTARRMLGEELTIDTGRLAVIGPGRDAFEASVAAAIEGRQAEATFLDKPVLLRERSGAGAIALYMLPVKPSQPSEGERFFSSDRVLVIAVMHDTNARADPAIVRDLLGLSLGEARLATLIGAGQSPREAARELNITEETARTVLKRVFQKVGVSRQSELAALLSRLALRG